MYQKHFSNAPISIVILYGLSRFHNVKYGIFSHTDPQSCRQSFWSFPSSQLSDRRNKPLSLLDPTLILLFDDCSGFQSVLFDHNLFSFRLFNKTLMEWGVKPVKFVRNIHDFTRFFRLVVCCSKFICFELNGFGGCSRNFGGFGQRGLVHLWFVWFLEPPGW